MWSVLRRLSHRQYKYFTLSIVRTITLTELRKALWRWTQWTQKQECTGSDYYTGERMFWDRSSHRRRNVQGQIITQEKECTGADNFSGMNVQGPTITREKECKVTIITHERECTGTDHCTENLSSSQELSQCLLLEKCLRMFWVLGLDKIWIKFDHVSVCSTNLKHVKR